MALFNAPDQCSLGIRVVEKAFRQRLAHGPLRTGREQHFRRRVEIAQAQILVEQQHRRAEVIQQALVKLMIQRGRFRHA